MWLTQGGSVKVTTKNSRSIKMCVRLSIFMTLVAAGLMGWEYDKVVNWQAEGLDTLWANMADYYHWQSDTWPQCAAWLNENPFQVLLGIGDVQNSLIYTALCWCGSAFTYVVGKLKGGQDGTAEV